MAQGDIEVNIQAIAYNVFSIEYTVRKDNRGHLIKPFTKSMFDHLGFEPVEMFYSTSQPRVIRGMHYQKDCSKLVWVIGDGSLKDVLLDIDKDSSNHGKVMTFEMHEGRALLFGPQYAHGFQVTSNTPVTMAYLMNREHSPQDEGGYRWDSFGVDWRFDADDKSLPILSDRDQNLPPFGAAK